jgi:hypothetical protein
MLITPEVSARLRSNLIFTDDEDKTGVQGAFTILVRNETRESIGELFNILAAITKAEFIIGQEVEVADVFNINEDVDTLPEQKPEEPSIT